MANLYVGRMFTYRGRCGASSRLGDDQGLNRFPPRGGIAIITHEGARKVKAVIGDRPYEFSKYYLLKEVEQHYDNKYDTIVKSVEVMMKAAEKLKSIDSHRATEFRVKNLIEQLTKTSVELRALAEDEK